MNALQNIPIAILAAAANAIVVGIIAFLAGVQLVWLVVIVLLLTVGGLIEGIVVARARGFGPMATLGQVMGKTQG